jgi:glycosyltransferase involved in cell wall biosynthesis
MRILHVNKFFDFRGGAETYLHALMKRQEQAGHEVHALSTRNPANVASEDASRFVERHDFAQSEGPLKDTEKGAAFIWNVEARRAMTEAIHELAPDVIHLHNIYHHLSTSILGPIREARIPCVQTLHDYKLACPNYKMFTEGSPCERCKGGNYLEAVKHRCLSNSTAHNLLAAFEMGMTKVSQSYEKTVRTFICPSEFMADKMRSWGEPPSKFIVLPNPVESPEVAVRPTSGVALYAGRLSPEKGIETLVRAAARVPEIRLRIAGIGPEEERLKSLVKSLGAQNIEFLGFLRSPELQSERRRAGVLAVPSVWYENAPLAVLEAMAEGLPIMASRIGGLPELVTPDQNGWLVEPDDVSAWTTALNAFQKQSDDDLAELGRASHARAIARHGWETHLSALDRIYTGEKPRLTA